MTMGEGDEPPLSALLGGSQRRPSVAENQVLWSRRRARPERRPPSRTGTASSPEPRAGRSMSRGLVAASRRPPPGWAGGPQGLPDAVPNLPPGLPKAIPDLPRGPRFFGAPGGRSPTSPRPPKSGSRPSSGATLLGAPGGGKRVPEGPFFGVSKCRVSRGCWVS